MKSGRETQTIRLAKESDLPAIVTVYNEAIRETTATFDTEEKTVADQKPWFEKHKERHPIFVCELNGSVVGWASINEWSDRCAYADTAENSVFVLKNHHGRGIGKMLMQKILEAAKERKYHTLIARISDGNEASLILHRNLGFIDIGTMREVGKKFGKLIDVHMLQLLFKSNS